MWLGGRAALADKRAASTSEVGRLETEILSTRSNVKKLMDLSGQWIDRVHQRKPLKERILDLDSSVSETYGRQEGSAYNGHFTCNCYHPLFCFNHLGDLERVLLRNGNVASADNRRSVLEPVIARYRNLDISKYFRGNAAFAIPELYSFLEDEDYGYAIRLKSNAVLERIFSTCRSARLAVRQRSLWFGYHQFMYQAGTASVASWPKWNGTKASCSPGSASSSRTCRGSARGLFGFTIKGARQNSGFARERTR